MLLRRVRRLNNIPLEAGSVCYWMSRDQRSTYNFALKYAQEYALEFKAPLFVVFNIVPSFLNASLRQYEFMLKGLLMLKKSLENLNIPLLILFGDPKDTIPKFIEDYKIRLLITDFDPLRIKKRWKNEVCHKIKIPFLEVDTHNIVPAFFVSDKKEYGAYTIRKKIMSRLNEFLYEPANIERHPYNSSISKDMERQELLSRLRIDSKPAPVGKFLPGEEAARVVLKDFIENRLRFYHEKRSDPNFDCQSNLSPYLHFGMIASQEAAIMVEKSDNPQEAKKAFLEEIIVRKELADNFCFYEENYDNLSGAPAWAAESLEKHKNDKRAYIYSLDELEQAKTHDPLWNASQIQMVEEGKMHNYLRMYWAKKILEWTENVETAIEIAVYLNDRYELDGRDPNGYTGIMWSICGVHDRPMVERKIFGKIRYMSYNGCKKKFDVASFVRRYVR